MTSAPHDSARTTPRRRFFAGVADLGPFILGHLSDTQCCRSPHEIRHDRLLPIQPHGLQTIY